MKSCESEEEENSLGRLTEGGESPVSGSWSFKQDIIPSSTGHEEPGVNQRGPNHVRLNTVTDR